MTWLTVDEAKAAQGLRLVLARGSYGAYSECAKNIMHVDQVPYAAAPQVPFGANLDLVAWTGVRNNPVAVYGDEPPRASWLEILDLAERLSPAPRLLPADSDDRAAVIGLSNELLGENGYIWCKRVEGGAKAELTGLRGEIMRREYRATGGDPAWAVGRMAKIIANLADRLRRQSAAGRRYFVGDAVSAIDIYWASVSVLVAAMDPALCPMPEALRERYAELAPAVAEALDPILIAHRDHVFRTYLEPMDFG